MLDIFKYYNKQKQIINLARALFELKIGNFVKIQIKDKIYLLSAAENLSPAHITYHDLTRGKVIISAQRANFLFDHDFHEPQQVTVGSIEQIEQLIFKSQKLAISEFAIGPANYAKSLLDLAVYAEILPALFVYELTPDQPIPGDLISIDESQISNYEILLEENFEIVAKANLHLKEAKNANIIAFRSHFAGKEHFAIIVGDPFKDKDKLIRIHSSCYTGDLLGSLACDCGEQLELAIKTMNNAEGFSGGIVIYLLQEGRGIGLTNKLKTYNLQEQGFDTVEANHALGFPDDARSFGIAKKILELLEVDSVVLLSNNPKKGRELESLGIKVAKTMSHEVLPNKFNESYLATKIKKLGHILKK